MTLRDMGALCLAPVVLMGYVAATDLHLIQSKHKTTVDNAAILEVQSCEKGLGIDVKAATNGLYGVNVQYGVQYRPTEQTSITFQPKFGMSYVDHPVVELPQRMQFGLGAALMFGYRDVRMSAELWHLSNGKALGLEVTDKAHTSPNIGVNMIAVMTGWVF